ncbi:MAG: hypothetical protein A2Y02_03485 [Omnitrophica bacterium GWA2_52_12]|nr:MAG: hypothetical protein A2Y02_03485 [Omnitrophica bacterium GWA2_52_12]
MKTLTKKIQALMLCGFLCASGASIASANFQTVGHQVTVRVPEILSITADTTAFTLTFSDFANGSESDTKTVVYSVMSNDMRQADGDAAMTGNVDFLFDRVDLRAQVGSYTKVAGNTNLAAASANYVSIADTNTTLANKANTDVGTDGTTMKGTIPITYKAVAQGDVPSGDQTHFLFITLTTR